MLDGDEKDFQIGLNREIDACASQNSNGVGQSKEINEMIWSDC